MVDSNSKPNRDTHPRAGLWRRIAALLYDGFLIAAIWVLLGFFILLLVGPNANQLVAGEVQTDSLVDNILFMLMVLSSASFYLYFWIRGGQTLGMLAWRIKVVDIKGNLITPTQGLIRFFLAWPAFFMLGLGYLWLYIDVNGDTIHDKVSSSKVVLLPKTSPSL